jgi:hypothetical protein
MLILGLTSAGSATARITQGSGAQRAGVHVVNLHEAYEARVGHSTLGQIAGVIYAMGQGPSLGRGGNSCAEPYCPVYYQGGLVQQNPHVYLLLWGPNWETDPNQEAVATYLESFYSGLGVESGSDPDNWSPITSQYGDTSGKPTFDDSVLQGTYEDTTTPPTGVDASQFAAEADAFTANQGITDLNDAQIVIATQSGTCPAGFVAASCPSQYRGVDCSYHDSSNEPFINLPYLLDAGSVCGEDFVNPNGTYDGFSMAGGHEYAEAITDPFPFTGWEDPYEPAGDGEIADKCEWSPQSADLTLSTGTFAMQPLWSNAANACVMSKEVGGDITVDSPGSQSDYHSTQNSLQIIGTSSYGYQLAWSASGLPAGLKINAASGLISGIISGAPGSDSVTVTATDPTGSDSVTFNWTVLADVGSAVANKDSKLCLNDYNSLTTPGDEIVLWKCSSTGNVGGNERFSHSTNPGPLIVFGQCLTDPHGHGAGQLLQIYPCVKGDQSQQWDYNSDNEYVLQKNSLCLTDPGDGKLNGTPSAIEKCTDATDQQWTGS